MRTLESYMFESETDVDGVEHSLFVEVVNDDKTTSIRLRREHDGKDQQCVVHSIDDVMLMAYVALQADLVNGETLLAVKGLIDELANKKARMFIKSALV